MLETQIQALNLQIPSPLQLINSSLCESKQIKLYIKRDDLIHPLLSGNKWRKLKYNLIEAEAQGKKTLLSFGGAYSNHIHALAAAGNFLGLKTIGVIRGERPRSLSSTLDFAHNQGMILHFISREKYRKKMEPSFIKSLYEKFGDFYLLPEGGSNKFALPGCAEIIDEVNQQLEFQNYTIATAVGSGGTIAGLMTKCANQNVIGVAALKNADFLNADINYLLDGQEKTFDLLLDYHFGGYAKINSDLVKFIQAFKQKYAISLEPVYTGKLMFALFDLIQKNYFLPGTILVALHTGGLQGLAGFRELQ